MLLRIYCNYCHTQQFHWFIWPFWKDYF